MNIYFRDQRNKMFGHLQRLKSVKIHPCKKFELREQVSEIVVNVPFSSENVKSVLDHYRIFPQNILVSLGEFETEKRAVRVGDVIVQQAYVPALPGLSFCLVMGVKVTAVVDEENRKGFSYKTLKGHVEKGVSTFVFERHEEGTLFRIHTFSRTAVPFLGLLVRPYQYFCTQRALANVSRQLQEIEQTSKVHGITADGHVY